MNDMEDLGSYYGFVFHDPQLRRVLAAEADQARERSPKSLSGGQLRFALARVLRDLAMRIEPSQPPASEAGRGIQAGQLAAR